MNKMLANYYFMSRKYLSASIEFEDYLFKQKKSNKLFKKKLIICYTQINKPEQALSLFYELIKEDIDLVINTDVVADDCPCPEIIGNVEICNIKYEDKYTRNYILGILWLYCDVDISLKYFSKAYNLNKQSVLKDIIEIIQNKLNTLKEKV